MKHSSWHYLVNWHYLVKQATIDRLPKTAKANTFLLLLRLKTIGEKKGTLTDLLEKQVPAAPIA